MASANTGAQRRAEWQRLFGEGMEYCEPQAAETAEMIVYDHKPASR